MNTDPIADLLTRIRNALQAGQSYTLSPYSNMKWSITQILKEKEFVEDVKMIQQGDKKDIKVIFNKTRPGLTLKRVSKPGRRVYQKSVEMKEACNGYGIYIISTSKGLMTGQEAKSQNLGGEVVCEIF